MQKTVINIKVRLLHHGLDLQTNLINVIFDVIYIIHSVHDKYFLDIIIQKPVHFKILN